QRPWSNPGKMEGSLDSCSPFPVPRSSVPDFLSGWSGRLEDLVLGKEVGPDFRACAKSQSDFISGQTGKSVRLHFVLRPVFGQQMESQSDFISGQTGKSVRLHFASRKPGK